MKKILLCSILALGSAAHAAEFGIRVHGVSHHFSERKAASGDRWNEQNTGFGVVLRDADISYQIGAYKNSLSTNKISLYARYAIVDYQGLDLYSDANLKISIGGFAGIVHGYPLVKWNKDGSVKSLEKHSASPALGLSARIQYHNFDVTFRLTPRRKSSEVQSSAVLSMETGYTF